MIASGDDGAGGVAPVLEPGAERNEGFSPILFGVGGDRLVLQGEVGRALDHVHELAQVLADLGADAALLEGRDGREIGLVGRLAALAALERVEAIEEADETDDSFHAGLRLEVVEDVLGLLGVEAREGGAGAAVSALVPRIDLFDRGGDVVGSSRRAPRPRHRSRRRA